MTATRIYLDHNATTPMRTKAKDAFIDACDIIGNPSAIHHEGRNAQSLVEQTRQKLADYAHIKRDHVIFTGNASEANNLLLHQFLSTKTIKACDNHPSLLEGTDNHAVLNITHDGFYDLNHLEKLLKTQQYNLLALTIAHNESGVIQNMPEIYAMTKKYDIWLHGDAVQAFGKINIAEFFSFCDSMTISAHKCGGAKGVGALLLRNKNALIPIIHGGGQEGGARAGTENIAAIHAFGAVIDDIERMIADYHPHRAWHRDMITEIQQQQPNIINAVPHDQHLPNTSLIMCKNIASVNLIMALDIAGFAVSAGSACSSGKLKLSVICGLMGYGNEYAASSLRISSGWNNSADDLLIFAQTLTRTYQQIDSVV